jgi:hypothetical protein
MPRRHRTGLIVVAIAAFFDGNCLGDFSDTQNNAFWLNQQEAGVNFAWHFTI